MTTAPRAADFSSMPTTPDQPTYDVLPLAGDLYEALQFLANAHFAYERTGDPRRHNIVGLHDTLSRQ